MSLVSNEAPSPARIPRRLVPDRLGIVLGAVSLGAMLWLPFLASRASRIAPPQPLGLLDSVSPGAGLPLLAVLALAALAGMVRMPAALRVALSAAALALVAVALGLAAGALSPAGNRFARISVGAGGWILLCTFALTLGDGLVRLRLGAAQRVIALALFAAAIVALLASGIWNPLSILMEYASRADSFARELRTHVMLAVGSLVAASALGIPLGIAVARLPVLGRAVMPVLSVVQTIPSMALFGLLIAPLAWLGTHLPGAAALGIAGIGLAPAFVALFAYALLPIVSATLGGLAAVPSEVVDAARGMGMTSRQRLVSVELPLAVPGILTGVRIVLVQNIGMTVIAGLVGGGGLGIFVFQGISQTATDLVLLGALPTVLLAFAAAVLLDAFIEWSGGARPEKA